MGNGLHIAPGDAREAVRFMTERGARRAKGYWSEELYKLLGRAEDLRPNLMAIRKELKVGRDSTRVSTRWGYKLCAGSLPMAFQC